MKRLTHERNNGIKRGYWSPNKKDELIERLAAYENIGFEPQEMKVYEWIPVEKELPQNDDYILLSFENYAVPLIGRYEQDENGGAFYCGDNDEPLIRYNVIVNAWKPLPEPYKPE